MARQTSPSDEAAKPSSRPSTTSSMKSVAFVYIHGWNHGLSRCALTYASS